MIKKKHLANKPELKDCLIVGLFSSSNLQVTISRVGISGFKRKDLEGKSGRLKNLFCLPVSPLYFVFFSFFFSTGPDEQLICVAFTFILHNI